MTPDEVTQQILEAWDEEEPTPVAEVVEPPSEEEPDDQGEEQDEEQDDGEAAEPEEDEDQKEEESEEDGEGADQGEEESVTASYESDNPEVQAFLAKYQGDVDKALRGAVELSRVIGRQGSEKAALAERVAELEGALNQATAFTQDSGFLDSDQQEWVEEAVNSGNPLAYIQRAVQDEQFDLARAVAREWSRENPFDGPRVGQQIDALEAQAYQAQQPAAEEVGVDTGILLDVLAENFPEMRTYEAQMVTVLSQLGPGHPLVNDARSGDPATAARGVIGIYEIARASTASVRTARDDLKKKHRKAGDEARAAAVVSSSSATPSNGATPRQRMIMPGLSFEDFEAEFAQK